MYCYIRNQFKTQLKIMINVYYVFVSLGPEFRSRLAGGSGSVSCVRLHSRCQQGLLSQCNFESNGYKFDVLQTMSSAVVQLYAADRNCMWSKKCSGVACLVKDNPQMLQLTVAGINYVNSVLALRTQFKKICCMNMGSNRRVKGNKTIINKPVNA